MAFIIQDVDGKTFEKLVLPSGIVAESDDADTMVYYSKDGNVVIKEGQSVGFIDAIFTITGAGTIAYIVGKTVHKIGKFFIKKK